MDTLIYRLRTEPVLIGALVEALIAVAVAFGLDLDAEQVAALMGVVAVVTGAVVRTKTNSKTFVDENLRDAEQAIKAARDDGLI